MKDYMWLLESLFCLASVADFRGQPEVRDILLELHKDISLTHSAPRKANTYSSNSKDVPLEIMLPETTISKAEH